MLKLLICCFLIVHCVQCGFFDLTDVDDPLGFFWNPRQHEQKFTECKVETQSGVKYGVCTPHSNCLLTGGRSNGFCGLLATCCIYERTCGKVSNTKVSYFEGSDVKAGISTCSYKVKLKNANICQLRLDFVKFNVAPARLISTVSAAFPIYKCVDDRLTVHPNHYNIPELCGNNDKQHVYIHVNQSDGVTKGVQLDISLADRVTNPQLQAPSWKIKITQLECPGRKPVLKIPDDETVQDFPLLAPLGAIQYFTERTGYIKSFGFDGSVPQQSYTYDQKYAMSFKRDIHTCGIKFSPQYINLPIADIDSYTDADCRHYLFVPELYFDQPIQNPNNLVARVCLITPDVFRSYAPGPLFVHFNSLDTNFITDETQQQGFNIKYELLNKCP